MADLENRVSKLEEKVEKLELNINSSLSDIKSDLIEIKAGIKNTDNNGDLKNKLIVKDVVSNTNRIEKLESNQSKFVWMIIGEIVAVISAAIITYIKIS